jgi:hypothetical protein
MAARIALEFSGGARGRQSFSGNDPSLGNRPPENDCGRLNHIRNPNDVVFATDRLVFVPFVAAVRAGIIEIDGG